MRIFLFVLIACVHLASSSQAQYVVFDWAQNTGSASDDSGSSIRTDALGNVYTAGVFQGTVDFDPGTPAVNLISAGSTDMFITKQTPTGDLIWAVSLGGVAADFGPNLAIGASGNLYVTGRFSATVDFDPGSGTSLLTSLGSNDIFILKLDAGGNFLWVKSMGGAGNDAANAVATDGSENIYTTGIFSGTVDFDPNAGVSNLVSAGDLDIFISKLDNNGDFVWAYGLGDTGPDIGRGIAFNSLGQICITGGFSGTVDFDTGTGTSSLSSTGFQDIYVSVMDADANLIWLRQFGAGGDDIGYGIASDALGNVYTTGSFDNVVDFFPGPGTFDLVSVGSAGNAFISKLDASGNFAWAQEINGLYSSAGYGIAVDASRNAFVAGNVDDPESGGATFILQFGENGDILLYKQIGIRGNGNSIDIGPLGTVHMTGSFRGPPTDFDIGTNVYNLTSTGGADIFVLKLGRANSCLPFSERSALVALYTATDGDNWTNKTNWLSDDESTWFGVTVSGCTVTEINLTNNNLSGPLPIEIGDLQGLIKMNLSRNQISGNIPYEIGYLSNLTQLNLEQNALDGTVPAEIGDLTSLTTLRLGTNQLTGDVPAIIGAMPALVSAYFSGNQLTSIPDFVQPSFTLAVENNHLDFGDLEVNLEVTNYTYSPQAQLPPGGFISFLPGGNLTIPFSTTGTANSYQWYKDGILIPGATSDTYLKSGANAADAGSYVVKITSSIVTGLTLESLPYTVLTDPCPPGPRTAGDLDGSFAPLINVPSYFYGLGTQSNGKIIVGTDYTMINSLIKSGILRFNTDGSLDGTFATNSYGPFLIVQPDDKIIAASGGGNLVRLLADGTDDVSFASPNYYNATIFAVALQPDGKIVVSVNEDGTIFLDRRNADGTNDPSFSAGIALPCSSIQVQPDGKILVADQFGGVVRLDNNGAIDTGFNTNGVNNLTGGMNHVTDMAIQADGKIIAVGLYDYFADFPHRGIVRLLPDGSIDNSFNATGITDMIDLGYFFNKISIQPDGKIVLAGIFDTVNGTNRPNLVRLNTDGTVDCSFNPGGSSDALIFEMMLQADGNILITGGFTSYDGTTRYGFARINNGGSIIMSNGNIQVCNVQFLDPGGLGDYTFNQNITETFSPVNPADKVKISFSSFSTESCCDFLKVYDGPTTASPLVATLKGNTLPADIVATSAGGQLTFEFTSDGDVESSGWVATISCQSGITINITTQPVDATVCDGATATFAAAASGTTNITYQWQFSTLSAGPYSDISNGAGYAGVTTSTLSVNTTGTFGAGRYRCKISGDLASTVFTNDAGLIINALPAAPTTTSASSCSASSFTLTAAGGVNGQYRWYSVATGGTAIPGEVNGTFTTPVIAVTTTYYVSINNGSCESAARAAVTATINTPPAAPASPVPGSSCGPGNVTVSVSGGVNGQYRWYTVPTGGTAISAEFNNTYTSFALGTTTIYYAAINNGTCESATRTAVNATINTIPAAPITPIAGSSCGTGNVTVSVSGASAGEYRWYTVPTGGTAIPGEVNGAYTIPSLASTTTYYAAINISSCESTTRTAVVATINPIPSAPVSPVPGNSCVPASVTVSVSGGVNGQYRWYTVAIGGTPIAGEVNDTYVTPVLASTTSYFASINDGTCESARTTVNGNINTVPKPPLVTSNCTTTSATLSGPAGFTTYAWSNGATTQQITVNTPGSYTLVVTAATGCSSPASDPTVFTPTFCNQSPVITSASINTAIEGSVSLDLSAFLSDPDNNLDLSTLKVTQQPASGAVASIGPNATLLLDYKGTSFAGTDKLTIEVCDLSGVCSQQVITIEVAGEIVVNTGISPNGDTKNDTWFIQYIEVMPDTKNNKVSVFNRWGDAVFETTNYDNVNRVFTGLNKSGNELPTGTYFYKIEFASGKETLTGYLSLKR